MGTTGSVSGRVEDFDAQVDALFESLRGNPGWDRLFYAASEAGDWSLIWHLLGAASAAANRTGFANSFRLSVMLGVESAIVNGAIKSMFERARPNPARPQAVSDTDSCDIVVSLWPRERGVHDRDALR